MLEGKLDKVFVCICEMVCAPVFALSDVRRTIPLHNKREEP